jgi:hypothetical protein
LLLGFDGIKPAAAHHVLGRPSYGLSEDSNTPPSQQLEMTSGRYFAIFMVFPAFPQPEEPARVNLYLSRLDDGQSYDGEVAFFITKDGWFKGEEDPLGVQAEDDKVYRQSFIVSEPGNYVIIARFESAGEQHVLEFPTRIGDTASSGAAAIAAGGVILVLVVVTLLQRQRLIRAKISSARDEARSDVAGRAVGIQVFGRKL